MLQLLKDAMGGVTFEIIEDVMRERDKIDTGSWLRSHYIEINGDFFDVKSSDSDFMDKDKGSEPKTVDFNTLKSWYERKGLQFTDSQGRPLAVNTAVTRIRNKISSVGTESSRVLFDRRGDIEYLFDKTVYEESEERIAEEIVKQLEVILQKEEVWQLQ